MDSTKNASPIPEYAFPVCMALLMSYGMELYNHVLMGATLSVATLLSPLSELIPMAIVVVVVERFIGGRLVERLMARIPADSIAIPYGVILGTVTCIVMCPMMSMVATLVFKHPTLATLASIWAGTFLRNLPFALAWALIVARPLSGAVVGTLSKRV